MLVKLWKGQKIDRDSILELLVRVQYERNNIDFSRGKVRVRGDVIEIFPAYLEMAIRVEMFGDEIEKISEIDPLTGKSIWSGVFFKGRGNFYSSPLIAGNHLYAAREDGMFFVAKLGETFEIVSEIDMKDRIIASPIAVSGRLLIRTSSSLFCVEGR